MIWCCDSGVECPPKGWYVMATSLMLLGDGAATGSCIFGELRGVRNSFSLWLPTHQESGFASCPTPPTTGCFPRGPEGMGPSTSGLEPLDAISWSFQICIHQVKWHSLNGTCRLFFVPVFWHCRSKRQPIPRAVASRSLHPQQDSGSRDIFGCDTCKEMSVPALTTLSEWFLDVLDVGSHWTGKCAKEGCHEGHSLSQASQQSTAWWKGHGRYTHSSFSFSFFISACHGQHRHCVSILKHRHWGHGAWELMGQWEDT